MTDKKSSTDDVFGKLLANRLRHERESRGWSITSLAKASGVSRAMISKIERGEASPTAALLGRLSGAFSLTVSALLARAEAGDTSRCVVRQSDQDCWTDPQSGYLRRALSPHGADPELVLIELPAGATVSYPATSYTFLRGQCVWILDGCLMIREHEEETLLYSGDCMAFDLSTARERTYSNPLEKQSAHYIVALARH
jgi:transcriptional regulator with XRE-family HTH domain